MATVATVAGVATAATVVTADMADATATTALAGESHELNTLQDQLNFRICALDLKNIIQTLSLHSHI